MTAEQDRIVHLLEGLQALARGEAAESLPRETSSSATSSTPRSTPRAGGIPACSTSSPAASARARSTAGRAACGCWSTTCSTTPRCTAASGGSVGVGLERDDGRLVVRVEDDGPGIPPDERERLLEPFARGGNAGPAAPGSGWRSSPSRPRCTAASCGSATPRRGGLGVEVRLPSSHNVAEGKCDEVDLPGRRNP